LRRPAKAIWAMAPIWNMASQRTMRHRSKSGGGCFSLVRQSPEFQKRTTQLAVYSGNRACRPRVRSPTNTRPITFTRSMALDQLALGGTIHPLLEDRLHILQFGIVYSHGPRSSFCGRQAKANYATRQCTTAMCEAASERRFRPT